MMCVNHKTRRIVGLGLMLLIALAIMLAAPGAALAQGPGDVWSPYPAPVPAPGGGPAHPGVPETPDSPMPPGVPKTPGNPGAPGDPAPNYGDCHVGNPNCASAQAIVPGPVHIWHDKPDGAPYRYGERIRISISHDYGGVVYLYDWQPYMGNWARLIGRYWVPAGSTRVVTARVYPPYGPEWLTAYDPYAGFLDRTHFRVVP